MGVLNRSYAKRHRNMTPRSGFKCSFQMHKDLESETRDLHPTGSKWSKSGPKRMKLVPPQRAYWNVYVGINYIGIWPQGWVLSTRIGNVRPCSIRYKNKQNKTLKKNDKITNTINLVIFFNSLLFIIGFFPNLICILFFYLFFAGKHFLLDVCPASSIHKLATSLPRLFHGLMTSLASIDWLTWIVPLASSTDWWSTSWLHPRQIDG